MGAADVVPGVSGGTVAFIVGIYDELIESIKNINLQSIKLLLSGKLADFWKSVNGGFLLALLSGILISVFSLAKIVTWLLEEHPILIWSFFFGLILASVWFVAKDIKRWNVKTIFSFVVGAAVAFYITVATPAETPTQLWFIFLSGAVAICAMILPGISGSFILVLLGKYHYIMEAVKSLNIIVLIVFAVGALVGITTFARILSYALKNFRDITLATLAGFMLGSLNKVWPWKTAREIVTHDGGTFLAESNIAPYQYVWEAVGLMVFGFFLVYFLEKLSAKTAK